jgi:hypothetical protein
MTDSNTTEFINSILKNLEANGFPTKKVSFPVEKMYELADNKGLSFNKVLEELKERENIEAEITTDKIIFQKQSAVNPFDNFNMDDLKNMDKDQMKAQAQEMMGQMNPEQMQAAQDMLKNMSPEEQQNLMQKAKEMGLF